MDIDKAMNNELELLQDFAEHVSVTVHAPDENYTDAQRLDHLETALEEYGIHERMRKWSKDDRVKFPHGFVAIKFPGYFWHVDTQQLYSIKVDGVLKPLKKVFPNPFNKIEEPGYRISVNGKRRFVSVSYLQTLKLKNTEIPIR